MRSAACLVILLASICIQPACAGTVLRYNILTLEPLPVPPGADSFGIESFATGISELGVVVGHSTLDRSGNVGRSRPVMWDASGQPTELWPYEGSFTPGAIPLGVNNAGQVVGRWGIGSGIPLPGPGIPEGRAFIWDAASGSQDLGSLGGDRVEAVAINEQGQVVGSSLTGRTSDEGIFEEAFIWDPENGMRGLGTLGGVASRATAINNVGQVVGNSWRADFSETAFFWDQAGSMQEIVSPSGANSRAMAINDVSQIIGFDFGVSGFAVWDGDDHRIIPVDSNVSLRPFDINNHGQMVGYIGVPGESRLEAFVWSDDRGLVRLNSLLPEDSGWNLTQATAINDRGQIVGRGWLNDEIRAFLMTPVPEPSTILMGLLGIVMWGARRVFHLRC